MRRDDLLEWIKNDGGELVDRYLPSGAEAELERVIRDQRHEVHTDAFLMFMSIRSLLRERGMQSCESDREAGKIMAQLNA
ncbi:hypothetical protein WKR88_07605 [Trinickia caryophylli]|uniref:Uncharacterized protein n=1 Tax=Trinickia caryophylli TaxID=28094 RepID=A0A1X7E9Z5_TRICW|nr:hypothetical protein [Trinickia caryophylli]PMS12982.1 hypothetical protein C0Z17_06745 [Trinickia caryophylli]TRX14743.1 hypothetical protein FNF07_26240 [Trinickia caryophylli]WQE14588.1 hypothetical protein U0034_28430 [Trinickia caryophylli]SMF30351.1 hypothetical protein SAMN06295900_105113 [Trinickia caryophylli]GLU31997.1 hypothetical protein Busp01_18390 [Trinickia caryophylli]